MTVAGTIQSGNSILIDGSANSITSNGDLEFYVNDGLALRLKTNATSPNLIGGHYWNFVESGAVAATISGGGLYGNHNRVSGNGGTVGGGADNKAGNEDADPTSATHATVGGGAGHRASHDVSRVGGGGESVQDEGGRGQEPEGRRGGRVKESCGTGFQPVCFNWCVCRTITRGRWG